MYFGFNLLTIGTDNVFDEYNKVINTLYKLYWDEHKSYSDIAAIFGYEHNPGNLSKIFK
mgnify:CR=1 FL=1